MQITWLTSDAYYLTNQWCILPDYPISDYWQLRQSGIIHLRLIFSQYRSRAYYLTESEEKSDSFNVDLSLNYSAWDGYFLFIIILTKQTRGFSSVHILDYISSSGRRIWTELNDLVCVFKWLKLYLARFSSS